MQGDRAEAAGEQRGGRRCGGGCGRAGRVLASVGGRRSPRRARSRRRSIGWLRTAPSPALVVDVAERDRVEVDEVGVARGRAPCGGRGRSGPCPRVLHSSAPGRRTQTSRFCGRVGVERARRRRGRWRRRRRCRRRRGRARRARCRSAGRCAISRSSVGRSWTTSRAAGVDAGGMRGRRGAGGADDAGPEDQPDRAEGDAGPLGEARGRRGSVRGPKTQPVVRGVVVGAEDERARGRRGGRRGRRRSARRGGRRGGAAGRGGCSGRGRARWRRAARSRSRSGPDSRARRPPAIAERAVRGDGRATTGGGRRSARSRRGGRASRRRSASQLGGAPLGVGAGPAALEGAELPRSAPGGRRASTAAIIAGGGLSFA